MKTWMLTLTLAASASLLGCAAGASKAEKTAAAQAHEQEAENTAPSFFKPKTEGDVNAMATLNEPDFQTDISAE